MATAGRRVERARTDSLGWHWRKRLHMGRWFGRSEPSQCPHVCNTRPIRWSMSHQSSLHRAYCHTWRSCPDRIRTFGSSVPQFAMAHMCAFRMAMQGVGVKADPTDAAAKVALKATDDTPHSQVNDSGRQLRRFRSHHSRLQAPYPCNRHLCASLLDHSNTLRWGCNCSIDKLFHNRYFRWCTRQFQCRQSGAAASLEFQKKSTHQGLCSRVSSCCRM